MCTEQNIENIDTGKPKKYGALSGRMIDTLIFHNHAELVNVVGDNDIRTHIVIAIKNSRPKHSRHGKRRTDICNGTTNVQWDHVQSPFRNVPISKWDPHCAKTDPLLFKRNETSPIILVDISGTVFDSAKFTSALKGPGLVVKVSYKKPFVPVSMQHLAVRVGVVFVSVELVNVAKMVNLHVGPRLTTNKEI